MDQDNASNISSNARHLCAKSWTAYFSIGLTALALFLIAVPIMWRGSWVLGLAMLAVSIIFVGYRVLLIRSYTLYYDDVGVWLYSGILPWKKGVSGVKWRDLDEAVYFQTLWSWLFNSYSIRIGHRFTKSNEVFLTHMAKGNESVVTLNSHHQELIRANALN